LLAFGLERGLEEQVLGWIAGEKELCEHHELRAAGGRLGAGGARFGEIARKVAYGWIQLGEGDGEFG